MTVSIEEKLSSPKKNAHSRLCPTVHKPVWVGAWLAKSLNTHTSYMILGYKRICKTLKSNALWNYLYG